VSNKVRHENQVYDTNLHFFGNQAFFIFKAKEFTNLVAIKIFDFLSQPIYNWMKRRIDED
jgi:hypothetical protein